MEEGCQKIPRRQDQWGGQVAGLVGSARGQQTGTTGTTAQGVKPKIAQKY